MLIYPVLSLFQNWLGEQQSLNLMIAQVSWGLAFQGVQAFVCGRQWKGLAEEEIDWAVLCLAWPAFVALDDTLVDSFLHCFALLRLSPLLVARDPACLPKQNHWKDQQRAVSAVAAVDTTKEKV